MSDYMENKVDDISLEELREILASKGLDIKEPAREAKELKAEKDIETKIVKKSTSKTTEPVFELALVNYPDFVIRRSTAKTEKFAVIMVSQNAYYIKTVKNGKEERETLDRSKYAAFTSGMKEMEMPEDFWFDTLCAGVGFYDAIMGILAQEVARKAITGGYFIKRRSNRYDGYPHIDEYDVQMYRDIPNLLKAFPGKDFGIECNFYKTMCDKFGLENVKDFIKERERSLVACNMSARHFVELLTDYDFKYESFKQYMLYDSVRLGYADDMWEFSTDWKDTLSMQRDLYGKIKNKYPKHLQEFHQQLAYKCRLHRQEIDKVKFKKRSEDTGRFEATIGEYIFIAPKDPQDFYDEATEMNNCLASYVNRYANGEDYIIFMRKKDTPDESLVTIELDLDGRLSQAYQSCNRRVTGEQKEAIDKWLAQVVAPTITKAA